MFLSFSEKERGRRDKRREMKRRRDGRREKEKERDGERERESDWSILISGVAELSSRISPATQQSTEIFLP